MAEPDLESLIARLEGAESRAQAAERERDWWMAQHDAVMQDWRDDLTQMAAAAPVEAAPEPASVMSSVVESARDRLRSALETLLGFFDPKTGSVTFRKNDDTLSDAFVRARGAIRATDRSVSDAS